jgi:hypothetical protein
MTQVRTFRCTIEDIMLHPHFARGLADIRGARPFDDRVQDRYWAYERGRQFGCVAPRTMPLFLGKKLNPQAVRLASAAFDRRELV